jgi:hypothetical protein
MSIRLHLITCLLGVSASFISIINPLQAQTTSIPNRSLKSPSTGAASSPSLSTAPKQIQHLQPHSSVVSHPKTDLPNNSVQLPLTQATALVNPLPMYFHPGALIFRDGRWDGGDHLFNLPINIGVFVEIIRPQEDNLTLTEGQIQRIVETIFSSGGIVTQTLITPQQPPLPFFQIQILLYPINKGYVTCCDGRLFESVALKRIIFDPAMAFQAITWEKQTLLVAPTEAIIPQIEKSVAEIAQAFLERFQSYEQRRRELIGPR